MKFCKICNSLYYIKNEGNKLMQYCKRCNFVDEMDADSKKSICIKLTDNSESYSTSSIRENKYIFKDPTLPRVDNSIVKCINNNCLSNTNVEDIYITGLGKDDKSFILDKLLEIGISKDILNIVDDETTEKLKISFDTNSRQKKKIIQNLIKENIQTINEKTVNIYTNILVVIYGLNERNDKLNEYISNTYEIPLESILITYDESTNQHLVRIKDIKLINMNQLFAKFDINKTFIYENNPCVLSININFEIVFIKYDEVNLKYIYMCNCCNSSWINNIKVNN